MPELCCPRCGQQAMGPAHRRGHCTSCGAPLTAASAPNENDVRAYLYGHRGIRLEPLGPLTRRGQGATR